MTARVDTLRQSIAALAARLLRALLVRAQSLTWLHRRGQLHQPTTFSAPNRYPILFDAARTLLADRPAPRLLSFGCAAGQEVVSLHDYFPDASIVGADINTAMLRACAALPSDPRRHFIVSTPANIAQAGPFDAIFCMAVLTYRPHHIENRDINDISGIYPFARFANQLRFLVDQLNDGGLLIVEHSLHRVEDVPMSGLTPVTHVATAPAKGPRFDPAGRRIDPQPVISRIFRKGEPRHDVARVG